MTYDSQKERTEQTDLLPFEQFGFEDRKRPEKESHAGLALWRKIRINHEVLRCFLSEFLGTLVLVTLGDGTVAQVVLGSREPMPRGNIVTINLGWGMAVTMGIFCAGGASHGHINPAFSVVKALLGELSWLKLPFYLLGQYLGAFAGAFIVYAVYYDALNDFDGGQRMTIGENATAGIFATYPQDHVTTMQGFLDQVVATGLLVLLALAITDGRNMEVPKGLVPISVGFVVVVLTTAFEFNCGAALNPARDLAPRIFTSLAGWGLQPFQFRNCNWFWVPIVGPHMGAVFGMLFYMLCVGAHWPSV